MNDMKALNKPRFGDIALGGLVGCLKGAVMISIFAIIAGRLQSSLTAQHGGFGPARPPIQDVLLSAVTAGAVIFVLLLIFMAVFGQLSLWAAYWAEKAQKWLWAAGVLVIPAVLLALPLTAYADLVSMGGWVGQLATVGLVGYMVFYWGTLCGIYMAYSTMWNRVFARAAG